MAGTLANLVIEHRMLPLVIAHGTMLIISPVVDVYLTLESWKYCHKDDIIEGK